MKNIEQIDKNFALATSIDKNDLILRNALFEPFRIYGIYHDGERYRRLPQEVADKTNSGVAELCKNTAGGRVRFITDSPYIAIKAIQDSPFTSVKMGKIGAQGFDLYANYEGKDRFIKCFLPTNEEMQEYESVVDFIDGKKERLITINFPLYSNVLDLYIGLAEDATLKVAPDYSVETPIVYYGSSVTQGGCASRAGTSYQAFITRWFDANHVNLGFSGSARGEDAIADYVASLDMSVFVFDYDHNAPSYDWLVDTHEKMLKKVRDNHPDIPIILTTKPIAYRIADHVRRAEYIKSVYEKYVAAGDKNIYFISGPELLKYADDEGTIDAIHPNDLGFFSMAKSFAEIMETFMERKVKPF